MTSQKIVLLHGFKPEETLAAMRAIKAALPGADDAAFATTTDINVGWKLGDLIEHVAEEHRRFKAPPKKTSPEGGSP